MLERVTCGAASCKPILIQHTTRTTCTLQCRSWHSCAATGHVQPHLAAARTFRNQRNAMGFSAAIRRARNRSPTMHDHCRVDRSSHSAALHGTLFQNAWNDSCCAARRTAVVARSRSFFFNEASTRGARTHENSCDLSTSNIRERVAQRLHTSYGLNPLESGPQPVSHPSNGSRRTRHMPILPHQQVPARPAHTRGIIHALPTTGRAVIWGVMGER